MLVIVVILFLLLCICFYYRESWVRFFRGELTDIQVEEFNKKQRERLRDSFED